MDKQGTQCGIAVLICLAVTIPADAQTPRIEISGGYQITRTPDQILPLGWNVDAAVNLDNHWSAVGELDRSEKTISDESLGVDVDLSVNTFSGGARWWAWRGRQIAPFLQLLTGTTRAGARAEILSRRIGESSTHLMLQPGGGVNLRVHDSFGVVGRLDYRRVFLDDDQEADSGENHFRVVFGIFFGL
jgi:hypothetical protein